MSSPYISVIFANRNDGYGELQQERFDTFVRYYSHFDKKYPGVFEFVVCDWNPPQNRPRLKEAVNWKKLKRVFFVTVDHEKHENFAQGATRPFFDYVARNVCIRRATGKWCLIVNQDIFPTPGIFEMMGRRQLDPKYFYRADRVDFDFTKIYQLQALEFVSEAKKYVLARHRRQSNLWDKISHEIEPIDFLKHASQVQPGETLDKHKNLIIGNGLGFLRDKDRFLKSCYLGYAKDPDPKSGSNEREETFYLRYKLHTNASGDFILAPREGFSKIGGCPERTDFYMHTDAYVIINLFMAGYNQSIFTNEEVIFHADHSRHNHMSSEVWRWSAHEKLMGEICRRGKPHALSREDWGFGSVDLPIECFTEGVDL